MSIIIFIIILGALVLVHEFGHFVFAKKVGMKVQEFGLGFPPKILTLWKKGETEYTLNAIPFGGFVKIFGENPDDKSISGPDSARSFVNKPKAPQALVLAAGVSFNLLFAWLLISLGFVFGMPTPVDYPGATGVENPKLIITDIAKNSPAAAAGLKSGDEIVSLASLKDSLQNPTPVSVRDFIIVHGDRQLTILYRRGSGGGSVALTPSSGILENQKAIGISMDIIGTLKLPIPLAVLEGAKTTYLLAKETAIGLAIFVWQAFAGRSNLSQITGPVGIVGIVGDVSRLGFVYLISLTALISINLAVINLIPFPALDGGRLLFVLIEAIKGSRINPKVSNALNSVGFALLLLLMVVVTFQDIFRIINP